VKSLSRFTIGILFFGFVILPAQAAFTGLYIFGDGLSTTNDNTSGLAYFYGQRYSNGRVWVEVLAQRQGLTISTNWSYFDDNSSDLVANVKNFTITQENVTNALFVVWVNNSDLYDQAQLNNNTNLTEWVNAINKSQTNHFKAITNLYAKGVRTLILPNAVDISSIPLFDADARTNFIHQRCIDYNIAFAATVNQATSACPGLKIYVPDFFALLTNVLIHAADYGLTNALSNGRSTSVTQTISPLTVTNNPGINYIFWDATDPTAKFHALIADTAQQLISPVQISQLTVLNGSNRLDMANIPIGLNGFVDGSTNLAPVNWTATASINSTNTTQTIFISPADQQQFYRLRFPYAWSWP
jgi:phospholipase/lecithinase/hemolysin